ncbi:MerR family transcriptional regulator [Microcoleus sp. Pol11C3]|uniref:MerR family transcriptional regulator n=1 Tax=Microcoleus sp. Pol11C3 TaxID=3055390 RepID=UPI004040A8FE
MYKISEFAAKVGVWVKTIQRWDNSGKLPARLDRYNRTHLTSIPVIASLIPQKDFTFWTRIYCGFFLVFVCGSDRPPR